MKLYHYTAVHHLHGGVGSHAGPGILNVGIRRFVHPYLDIAGGVVWLTDSPDWSQTWSTRDVPVPGYGPCNRTEARVEVSIPRRDRASLVPWRVAREFVLTAGLRDDLERFGDPEHWYVFAGDIPRGWLRLHEATPLAMAAVR
jgi:hypothetical protein